MTDTKTKTSPEESAAAAMVALQSQLEKLGLETFAERLSALEEIGASVKGLDPAKIAEQAEKLTQVQEDFRLHLKGKRDHGYISGIEDMEEKFSLTRALCGYVEHRSKGVTGEKACKQAFEAVGGGLEHEIITQATAKMREKFPEVYGHASSTFDDDNAGGFIPDQVLASEIILPIYRRSIIVNLGGTDGPKRVRVLDGITGRASLPRFGSGTIAYWLGEEDAIQESYAKTKMQELTAKKIGVLTRVTKEMREGQAHGWDGLVENDMTEALSQEIDYSYVYGQGGNMPTGIMRTQGVRVFSCQNPSVPGADEGRNLQELYVGDLTEEGVAAPITLANAQGAGTWDGGLCDFDALEAMSVILEEDDVREENLITLGSPTYFRKLKQQRVLAYAAQAAQDAAYLAGSPTLSNAALASLIGEYDKSSLFTKKRILSLVNGKKVVTFQRNKSAGDSVGVPDANVGDIASRDFNDVVRADLGTSILGRWNGLQLDDDGGMGIGFASGIIQVKLVMRLNFHHKQPRKIMVCPDANIKLA